MKPFSPCFLCRIVSHFFAPLLSLVPDSVILSRCYTRLPPALLASLHICLFPCVFSCFLDFLLVFLYFSSLPSFPFSIGFDLDVDLFPVFFLWVLCYLLGFCCDLFIYILRSMWYVYLTRIKHVDLTFFLSEACDLCQLLCVLSFVLYFLLDSVSIGFNEVSCAGKSPRLVFPPRWVEAWSDYDQPRFVPVNYLDR